MAAKKIKTLIKINIPAGAATPAPPVGTALGPYGLPGKEVAATLTQAQAEEIAKTKMEDLNTTDLVQAVSIVKGTARSMGVKVQ